MLRSEYSRKGVSIGALTGVYSGGVSTVRWRGNVKE